MILDIPAVADTEGDWANITWSPNNQYAMSTLQDQRIEGFGVGTFALNDSLTQQGTGAVVLYRDLLYDKAFLVSGPFNGIVPTSTGAWVGPSGTFYPSSKPKLYHTTFIHVTPRSGVPYVLNNNDIINIDGVYASPTRPFNQTDALRWLVAVKAAFTIPMWARSWWGRNISGADMYLRYYRPNIEGNVIDTSAVTFGEDSIVGQRIAADEPFGFFNGDFQPGSAYAICAASAAANGVVIEFNP